MYHCHAIRKCNNERVSLYVHTKKLAMEICYLWHKSPNYSLAGWSKES